MTQEDKELLLIDLCARKPHGLKYQANGKVHTLQKIDGRFIDSEMYTLEEVKPYLRPLSSMTEEEKKEYHKQGDIDLDRTAEGLREQFEAGTFHPENKFTPQYCHIDWLNANHFDYRIVPSTGKTLIESGLALEALKEMYKTE